MYWSMGWNQVVGNNGNWHFKNLDNSSSDEAGGMVEPPETGVVTNPTVTVTATDYIPLLHIVVLFIGSIRQN